MNTARRFPSITNEGAIRPHENAFQSWSSPDVAEFAPVGGFGPTMPSAGFGPLGLAPSSTERADTMAAHQPPPSFIVYTPDQMKAIPYRKSAPGFDDVQDDNVGARTLLKWTGIGIVAGLAVLTALIVVLNFGGDRNLTAGASTRSALVGNTAKPAAPAAQTPAPAKLEIAVAKPAAIELDTPAAPVAPAKKPAKTAAKKKR